MMLFSDEPKLTDHQFKLKGGRIWTLSQEKYDEWMENLKQYDVEGEIRKAKQWLLDNKRKRKTPKGMPQFLSSWIMRSEETGHVTVDPEKSPSEVTYSRNIQEKINHWKNVINDWPVQRLRASKLFMGASRAYPEFAAWAIEQRPELKTKH